MSIPIVDVFAGPGGLGEGFSAVKDENGEYAFHTVVSAEMEESARRTLRLRAFKRLLERSGKKNPLQPLYDYYQTGDLKPLKKHPLWKKADSEALKLTLGEEKDNKILDQILTDAKLSEKNWVLIGGPPCQAYSLVGRARNIGKKDYKAETDHRHFLYKEYLRLIQKFEPAVFVMENVKGILSSKIEKKLIFNSILEDLNDPNIAFGGESKHRYKIHSLTVPKHFDKDNFLGDPIKPHDFIIRSEDYGIPQSRHRVILVGVRSDLDALPSTLKPASKRTSVCEAIEKMPKLRSKISRVPDNGTQWEFVVKNHLKELILGATSLKKPQALIDALSEAVTEVDGAKTTGAIRYREILEISPPKTHLEKWLSDSFLRSKGLWLNNEVRGHMTTDLSRYAYAACYGVTNGYSPKGHKGFDLPGLRPNHKNWESGKFADRFRVQIFGKPSTTITSHISKDGHYFIHPDPAQCRSLTVREAARLQTFPDNYFFEGNRTQQYVQVGNAVPPLLAYRIAIIIEKLMKKTDRRTR
ncbi:MAG: DNA (cytosine-5)-methyltransferase 1 [Marivirga sp.]|jgi:DNA (cytosine-5)-methyltransferase 1